MSDTPSAAAVVLLAQENKSPNSIADTEMVRGLTEELKEKWATENDNSGWGDWSTPTKKRHGRQASTEPNSENENSDPNKHRHKKRRIAGTSSTKDIRDMQELMQLEVERRRLFEGKIVKAKALDVNAKVHKARDGIVNILTDNTN